jgi:hypothetical protein
VQWHKELPGVDVGVMAEVARVLHVARLLGERLSATAAEHGLQLGEGDVLFTLRRAGAPYRLSPTELAGWEMLSVMSEREREQLSRLMRKLLAGLEAR